MSPLLDVDPREQKLPKWAAEKLAVMRLRLNELSATIHSLTTGTTQAPFYLERFRPPDGVSKFYLPMGHRLRFEAQHTKLDLSLQEASIGRLIIYGDGVRVMPRAANSLSIECSKDY